MIVKMRLIILVTMTIIPVVVFAHAGKFDRYLERLVSIDAVVLTIVFMQVWFRSITYYTDEEYALNGYKLYPEISGLEHFVTDATVR